VGYLSDTRSPISTLNHVISHFLVSNTPASDGSANDFFVSAKITSHSQRRAGNRVRSACETADDSPQGHQPQGQTDSTRLWRKEAANQWNRGIGEEKLQP
jgi:hypothetical protein